MNCCKLVKDMLLITILMWGMALVCVLGVEREMEAREAKAAARVALEVRQ